MIEFEIVDASKADVVAEIVRAAFGAQARILGMDREKHPFYAAFETSEMVRERMGRGEKVVIGWLDGKPVGTIRYVLDSEDPERGWINRLAVLPEYRGQNLGDELMAFAEERLREMGAQMVRLALVAEFGKLRNYYESLGYQAYDKKKFEAVPFETLFMEKMIGVREKMGVGK